MSKFCVTENCTQKGSPFPDDANVCPVCRQKLRSDKDEIYKELSNENTAQEDGDNDDNKEEAPQDIPPPPPLNPAETAEIREEVGEELEKIRKENQVEDKELEEVNEFLEDSGQGTVDGMETSSNDESNGDQAHQSQNGSGSGDLVQLPDAGVWTNDDSEGNPQEEDEKMENNEEQRCDDSGATFGELSEGRPSAGGDDTDDEAAAYVSGLEGCEGYSQQDDDPYDRDDEEEDDDEQGDDEEAGMETLNVDYNYCGSDSTAGVKSPEQSQPEPPEQTESVLAEEKADDDSSADTTDSAGEKTDTDDGSSAESKPKPAEEKTGNSNTLGESSESKTKIETRVVEASLDPLIEGIEELKKSLVQTIENDGSLTREQQVEKIDQLFSRIEEQLAKEKETTDSDPVTSSDSKAVEEVEEDSDPAEEGYSWMYYVSAFLVALALVELLFLLYYKL